MATAASVSLLATMLGVSAPATAAPDSAPPPGVSVRAAPESTTTGSLTARAARVAAEGDEPEGALSMPSSYPFQPKLKVYPDAANDAAEPAELIGYDDIAPRLQAAMRKSDRISTQIVGESTQGRQLYLVTVTAPEDEDQTAQQTAWRKKIRTNPEAAATDADLKAGYKTPIWISSNIHGNEWEGTDASLDYIDELATAPWNEVKDLLRGHRLYFSVVLNPDGRTIGTRATALNLDANRDMITNTTPESLSFVRTAHAVQALYAGDFHGYTSVLQVEPCGPPHGDDYEYDLFIPHAYAAALRIERDVVDAEIPGNTYYNVATGQVVATNTGPDTDHIKIPYRDTPTGWDDFPPIFTAQYAAFTGAVSSTIELPKSRNGSGGRQSPANAAINSAVAKKTMESLVAYVAENDAAMLADQVEFFRRANAGAEKTALTQENIAAVPGPDQWKPLWNDSDDQGAVVYPRGFVIGVGEDQRSVSDARKLVASLIEHNIAVRRLDAATTLGGTTYPKGSYVIDMHQPNRNLAHALLSIGADISNRPGILSMYDVSAWSWGHLWGADVESFGTTGEGAFPASSRVTSGNIDGTVATGGKYLTFELAGVNDFRTLNALLEDGVKVSQLSDGSAIVGAGARGALEEAAEEFDVDVEQATAADVKQLSDGTAKGLKDLTIGYTGNQDDLLSLTQLGFDDLKSLTAASITADPAILDDVDVLWLGANLSFSGSQTAGRDAVQAFVDDGGSIVGRTANAFNVAKTFGLIADGTAVTGNSSGNGIVALDTPGDVLKPYAQQYGFVYPAEWITGLPESVTVERTYATGNPLQSGHWRATNATNGPLNAAGQAAAVSASLPSGAKAFVFGTSPVYRTHTKGGMSDAARALFWAASDSDGAEAPIATTTALKVPAKAIYPKAVTATVTVKAAEGTAAGTVQVREGGKVLATRTLANGSATVSVKGLKPGSRRLTAVFSPASDSRFTESTSSVAIVKVAKARSATAVKAKAAGKGKVKVTVRVKAGSVKPTGKVRIRAGAKTKWVTLKNGRATATFTLAKGTRKVTATYAGSSLVGGSAKATQVRVR